MTALTSQLPRQDARGGSETNAASRLGPLAVGAVVAGALHVAGVGANLGLNSLLAWLMPSDEFGLYAVLSNQALLVATLGGAGLPLAVIRFYPQCLSRGDTAGARRVAYAMWRRSRGLAVMAGAISLAVVVMAHGVTGWPDTLGPWIAGAALASLVCVANYQLELARSIGGMGLAYSPMRVGWPTVTAAVVCVVATFQGRIDALAAVVASICALTILVVGQAGFLRSRIGKQIESRPAKASDWRRWTQVSRPLWVMAVGASVLATADVVAIGLCLGDADAGRLHIAKRIAALTVIGQFAINARFATTISSLVGVGSRGDGALRRVLARAAVSSLATALPIALAMLLYGRHVLAVFGSDFTAAYGALAWLAMGQLVNASGGAVGCLLNVSGNQRANAAIVIGSAVFQVLACVALAPTFGLVGAGLAMCCSAVIRNVALAFVSRASLGVDPTIVGVWSGSRGASVTEGSLEES